MYQLVLVDDETMTREGIRTIINWEQLGIAVAGEASDGLAALNLIYTVKPDILICDIRMPHLDGITLITRIRNDFPNLQVIFLSGYSEKEYLKQAIRLNAVDYLDKPFRPFELLSVIEQCLKRLEEKTAKPVPAEDYFHILSGIVLGETPAAFSEPPEFPIRFSESYFTLIASFNHAALFADRDYYDSFEQNDIGLFLQQHIREWKDGLEKQFGNRFYAYILHNRYVVHVNTQMTVPEVKLRAENLKTAIPGCESFLSLSFGSLYRGIRLLPESYQEALRLKRNFLEGYGTVFPPPDKTDRTEYRPDSLPVQEIIEALSSFSFTDASYLLSEYFTYAKDCRKCDIDAIRNDLIGLSVRIDRLIHPNGDSFQYAAIEKVKFHCCCLKDIRSYFEEQIEKLIGQSKRMNHQERIVYELESFIIGHYSEELSLPQLAGQVYLTPTYMCHLYKKETGRTITEFITEIRMKKAYEYLKEPSLGLAEISGLLGYKTQNYFTKAFTGYYHLSPTKMRKKLLFKQT